MAAFQALNTDVSTQPHHLPLVTSTGVLLLQTDNIAELYLKDHYCNLRLLLRLAGLPISG